MGGLAFDETGSFGGQLVAVDTNGKIFLVDSGTNITQLVDLAARTGVSMRAEGIAVAPSAFGPLGGQVIVGIEGNDDSDPQSGKVYAVNVNGAPTLPTKNSIQRFSSGCNIVTLRDRLSQPQFFLFLDVTDFNGVRTG